jgi:RNA polymerase nonessential primary-like sigma factor
MPKTAKTTTPSVTVDSVRQYLREIGRYPLLTHEQEITYGKQVQRMLAAVAQREELAKTLDRPVTEAEWAEVAGLEVAELMQMVRSGEWAKRRLVEANLRLVVSVAKKYQKLNMEMLDLLQEGGIGLQRAAEKFDPTKGYRFSTYSYWWIRQAMTRAISEQSRTVRLPVHMTEKLGKIKKTQRQLALELGRQATIAEIAEVLELKPQQVRDCLLQSRQPISLDIKIGSDQKTELVELLEDDGATPDEYATLTCLREDLENWMLELTPQQRQVLRLRYGLKDNQPMTLQQIAEILKLTRERIRQIEHAAIKRLRKCQMGMTGYLAG